MDDVPALAAKDRSLTDVAALPRMASTGPRPRIAVTAPALNAVTGVSTHLRMMLNSRLAARFELLHFQIGSEGRQESRLSAWARYLLSPLQLAVFLLNQRPALLQLNTSINDAKSLWRDYVYHFVSRLCGVPFILQMHGDTDPNKLSLHSRMSGRLVKRYLRRAGSVAVLSRAEIERYRRFDPSIHIKLVPNAIDVREVADARREPNLSRPLRLVFLGRLVRTKGLVEALQALRQLKDEGRRFEFVMAGSGSDESLLRSQVSELGLDDRVRFAGALQGRAKWDLWLSGDVFVFPTWFEGLPYALLEAMAAGCVPVATAVGAIPDVVTDGVHGRLVELKDPTSVARAIVALDDDREYLQRLSEEARRRAIDCYSLDRLADDFESLYARTLGE
jgi:glycosyltransferase involved in cell wall biosynthesis